MGKADFLKRADWNAFCDRCGEKRKASNLKKTWDGYYVCPESCWETRQPQDFLRGVKDDQSVPWTRPEQPDQEVDNSSWLDTQTAVPKGTNDNSL